MISLLPGADGARALSGEKLAAVRFFVPSDFLLTQIPEKKGRRGWQLDAREDTPDTHRWDERVHEMAVLESRGATCGRRLSG